MFKIHLLIPLCVTRDKEHEKPHQVKRIIKRSKMFSTIFKKLRD